MLPRRRLLLAVSLAALVAAPAAVLAGLCIGNSCSRSGPTEGRVPFCSLDPELRASIADGFRDGRSPHVLAVAGETPLESPVAGGSWPSIDEIRPPQVPLVFAGSAVFPDAEVPAGTMLDAVAPTLAEMIGLRRPHPGVRSGVGIPGLASGDTPRLAVLVAWKGMTSRELDRHPQLWPVLRGLVEDGAGTLEADPGSLPSDSAAILTTIGTGALPRDHGITGSLVRNDQGEVVEPWGKGSPFSVVAALGDDLEELLADAPRIGVVGTHPSDRGLIGGNWYNFLADEDDDDVIIERDLTSQTATINGLLDSGYGGDDITDLLAVTLEGSISKLDEALGRILVAAQDASGGSLLIAVTSTGSGGSDASDAFSLAELETELQVTLGADVIDAVTPGGFFLDQEEMTRTGLGDDRVVAALRQVKSAGGQPLFADVFPALAVTFARYC